MDRKNNLKFGHHLKSEAYEETAYDLCFFSPVVAGGLRHRLHA